MTLQADPIHYVIVDENEAGQFAGTLPETANGFVADQLLPHDKFNKIARSAGVWKRWLDQTRIPVEQAYGTETCRLAENFRYQDAAGLVDVDLVSGDLHYLISGRYVSLTQDRLVVQGFSPYTFTALKDHHFYVDASGTVEVEVVAIGTPAAPGVGQVHLVTHETDGTDIVGTVIGDAAFDIQRLIIDRTTHYKDHSLVIDAAAADTSSLSFSIDADTDQGWKFARDAAGALFLQEMIGGSPENVIDFGSSVAAIQIDREIDANELVTLAAGLEMIPTTGLDRRYIKHRSKAPADATDATLFTYFFRREGTAAGAGASVFQVFDASDLPNSTQINLDVTVTFTESGDVDTATYQKWHVIIKKVAGTTSHVAGGGVGDYLATRAGSTADQATNVSWGGTALGVIQLLYTATAAGRVTVSGVCQITRYD